MVKSSIMCIRGSQSIKHEREKHNVQESVSYSEARCNIMWLIRGESHVEFRMQCVISYTQVFIVSNFLLVQFLVKLRNSEIYKNYQL